MPNISPYADTPSAIRYIRECAEKNVTTNILLAGALTKKIGRRQSFTDRIIERLWGFSNYRLSLFNPK